MNLKQHKKVDSFDLVEGELDFLKENDEKFWESIRNLLRYGIPSSDDKGHSNYLRIRVRPIQTDIIAGIRERMPEGWFKNQGSLYRSIVAVGCKTAFKLLDSENSQWHDVLLGLGEMSKKQRLAEFQEDMKVLKGQILNGSMPSNEKVTVVDFISRLEKKVVGE